MPGDQGSTRPRRSTGYLPGLDGLRAISVVAVLLYHADMPWLPGGFLGVEVFFVISGYLITHAAHPGAQPDVDDLAARLLAAPGPAAAGRPLHAAGDGVGDRAALLPRGRVQDLAGQVWAALIYVTNWFLIISERRTSRSSERPPVFQHLWSLAIEEQFYLVWPLLLLGLLRAVQAAATCRSPASSRSAPSPRCCGWPYLFEPAMDPSRAYYGTDTRASGLLLGAALALVWKPGHTFRRDAEVKRVGARPRRPGRPRRASSAASPSSATPTRSSSRAASPCSSVASCVAIIARRPPRHRCIGRLLGLPVMVWVGKRSYSLYLWHWPIFVYTRPQIDTPLSLYPTLVLRLVLTVVAAELSYRFVEVPIRNGAFRRWRQRLAAATAPAAHRSDRPRRLGRADPRRREHRRRHGGSSSCDGPAHRPGRRVPPADRRRRPGDRRPTIDAADGRRSPTPTVATAGDGRRHPVAGAVAPTTAAGPPTDAERRRPGTITVLGDSVLLGAKDQMTAELQASGYTVDYRAAAGADDPPGATRTCSRPARRSARPWSSGSGHNSLWERDRANYDKWARKFDGEADALIQTLESLGAKKIIWVTLREPSESVIPPAGRKQFDAYVWYFPYVNERLRPAAASATPTSCSPTGPRCPTSPGLTYDAMHLTKSGIRLMIDTIRSAGGF